MFEYSARAWSHCTSILPMSGFCQNISMGMERLVNVCFVIIICKVTWNDTMIAVEQKHNICIWESQWMH